MFCEKCGNNLPEDAKFCNKCGKPVELDNTEDKPKHELDKGGWAFIAIASVILGVIIIVIINLSKSDGISNQNSPASELPKGVVSPNQNSSASNSTIKNSALSTLNVEQTPEQYLLEISNEVNKTLPKMVDDATQLTSTSVSENKLTYNYKYLGSTLSTQTDLNVYQKNAIIEKFCTQSEIKPLKDYEAFFVYSYTDKNGKYIGSITVYPSDCTWNSPNK